MNKTLIIISAILLAICASCSLSLAEPPTVVPPSGAVKPGKPVTITTTVKKAQIRYTLDGTDPTYESTLYESQIWVFKNTVVKAAAFKSKRMVSEIGTATYTVKATTPTATASTAPVAPGTYVSGTQITLSCTTPDVSIYYTTNGTTPTSSSTKYTGAITLKKNNTTIKAIAIDLLNEDSDVLSVTYNVKTAKPVASVASGAYGTPPSP